MATPSTLNHLMWGYHGNYVNSSCRAGMKDGITAAVIARESNARNLARCCLARCRNVRQQKPTCDNENVTCSLMENQTKNFNSMPIFTHPMEDYHKKDKKSD